MSSADAEAEGGDETEPDADQAAGGSDLPEMTEEDFADVDVDVSDLSDEVEAEAGAEAAGAGTGGETETDEDGEETVDSPSGETWGDMYVGTLCLVSNAIIEEHGTEDAEPVEEGLARQLHLDAYFNEFMESRGKSDMPPEQALLIGTTMFLVVVVGSKTDIPEKIMEEAEI